MARGSLTPFREASAVGRSFSDPFWTLHREMNRLFDDALHGVGLGQPGPSQAAFGHMVNASMNVSETDSEICVRAELPGVSEEDVEVTLDNDVLTISGEKKFEESRGGEKENFHFIECSYGSFRRSLQLPHSADPDQVRASFEKGVLTITIPKSQQRERSHKIRIESQPSSSRGMAEGSAGERQTGMSGGSGSTGSERSSTQTSGEGHVTSEARSQSGGAT